MADQKPKFLSFDEWLANNPEFKDKTEPCDTCNGTGLCECDRCDDQHDCGHCDGKGYYDLAKEEYEKQLEMDKKKYSMFLELITNVKQSI